MYTIVIIVIIILFIILWPKKEHYPQNWDYLGPWRYWRKYEWSEKSPWRYWRKYNWGLDNMWKHWRKRTNIRNLFGPWNRWYYRL